jgi:hypothetical protein
MPPVIRIPDALYTRLEKHAKGFDTPANVIERLLNQIEGVTTSSDTDINTGTQDSGRDTTKYQFRGHTYRKNRLVLAVVHAYVEDKSSDISSEEIMEAFPKKLQGSIGVVTPLSEAQSIYERTGHKRHFLKKDEIIQASPFDIAVCTEWGKGNIDDFIRYAESLGYEIEPQE